MPHTAKMSCVLLLGVGVLFGLGIIENATQAMPAVQRTVLANQLVLLASEEHALPFVTVQLLIEAGSWLDPAGEEGLAALTARGLLLGTSTHSGAAIQEELDFMGASLRATARRDYATLSLQVLKKDLGRGLELFMEVLTQPVFPDDELHREREKTLAAMQAEEDEPGEVAEKAFQRALFPTSSYGHPVEGLPASVAQLKREAVVRFYQRHYHPNQAILAVVGDITAEEVQAQLHPRLAAWPTGAVPATPFSPAFERGPKTITIDRAITQAHVILGHVGISRGNPDFYALSVMNHLLGEGGFASRLVEAIRDQRGLAYSVASFFEAGKYPGAFQVALQTKNASVQEAIALAVQQLERMRTEPVSEEELEGAKKALVGSFPLRLGTQAQLAAFLTQVEYYGVGLDYPAKYPPLIASVSSQDVLRVAQAYLHPRHSILVIVANLKEAGLK
jgi:zinc protease